MEIPHHLTCLLRNLYADQEITVRPGHGKTNWFQIGIGVHQGCVLLRCLFNLPREGNDNPLQYPCLENSMDGGGWQATVHRVTSSWTRPSNFTPISMAVDWPFCWNHHNPTIPELPLKRKGPRGKGQMGSRLSPLISKCPPFSKTQIMENLWFSSAVTCLLSRQGEHTVMPGRLGCGGQQPALQPACLQCKG